MFMEIVSFPEKIQKDIVPVVCILVSIATCNLAKPHSAALLGSR